MSADALKTLLLGNAHEGPVLSRARISDKLSLEKMRKVLKAFSQDTKEPERRRNARTMQEVSPQ